MAATESSTPASAEQPSPLTTVFVGDRIVLYLGLGFFLLLWLALLLDLLRIGN